MNNVESLYLEQMQNDNYQQLVHDDFGFADSIIDQHDINKVNTKE